MDTTCIVTANAGRARFFAQARPNARLDEINDMINPAARLRTTEPKPMPWGSARPPRAATA